MSHVTLYHHKPTSKHEREMGYGVAKSNSNQKAVFIKRLFDFLQ
ncbi:MAG: hypothetical protein K0S26_1191 [Bacteroidota bacterium]|jgi:hypothetical protein|nr:hypothetical protein [Bacteroidota bacterium]